MRTRDPESPSVFPDGQTTKNLTKRSNWVIRSSFLLSSFEKCLPSFSRQTITFPEQEQFKPFPRVRLVLEMFSGCRNTWFGDHYGRMFDIRGAQHVPITGMKTFRNGSMCMYKLPIIFSTLEVLSPWGREWILMSLQMLFATNWNLCSLSYQLVEIPVICSHPWKKLLRHYFINWTIAIVFAELGLGKRSIYRHCHQIQYELPDNRFDILQIIHGASTKPRTTLVRPKRNLNNYAEQTDE